LPAGVNAGKGDKKGCKNRKSLTLAAGTFNLNLITIVGRLPAFELAIYKIILNT
jgi:hypothetical protein